MPSSVLRLVAWLALALVSLAVVPSAASASSRTPEPRHAKHTVARAAQGVSVHAAVHEDATSDSWASVDDDDDDDDADDDGDGAPDPDHFGPTSHLPLPGPTECPDTGFGAAPTGRGAPGIRELPEDPP